MKEYKKICAVFAFVFTIGFQSCTKENGVFKDNGNFGIVELALPARTTSNAIAKAITTVFEAENEVILPIKVQLTGSDPALEDIRVTLAVKDNIVERYNSAWQSTYEALPNRLYEVGNYEIIIPRGQKEAILNIKIIPPRFTELDFTKAYALAVHIVSSSTGTVSGNYAEGLYAVSIKNKYDGVYQVSGTFQDYANAGFSGIYPQTIDLTTLTGNKSEIHYKTFYSGNYPYYYFFNAGGSNSYFGNWSPIFTFDTQSNKVTAVTNHFGQGTNGSGRSGEIDLEANNYYDPETKTIHVTYYLVQPAGRRAKFTEVYTFKEAR